MFCNCPDGHMYVLRKMMLSPLIPLCCIVIGIQSMLLTQFIVHMGQQYRQMVSVVSTYHIWVVSYWQGVFVFLCPCFNGQHMPIIH